MCGRDWSSDVCSSDLALFDGHKNRWPDWQMGGWTGRRIDGWVDGLTSGCIDGWEDGRMDSS